jgi:hypothetical protein
MSKRFHETEIWNEDWWLDLPEGYDWLWFWIKDKCDHAGIWKPNITAFKRAKGKNVELKKALELFNADKIRVRLLSNGRWFIEDFIPFQYGHRLNEKNRVHASILEILKKNEIALDSIKGLFENSEEIKEHPHTKEDIKAEGKPVVPKLSVAIDIYDYYAKIIKPGAKVDAVKSICRLLKEGFLKEGLIGRIDAYKKSLAGQGDSKFYIQANNFFGEQARFKDFEPVESKLKPADPNCKVCKGTGWAYIEATNSTEICKCRLKK